MLPHLIQMKMKKKRDMIVMVQQETKICDDDDFGAIRGREGPRIQNSMMKNFPCFKELGAAIQVK